MQTRSFYRVFRGFLTLVIVGTIGMTAQLVFTIATWRSSTASILLMGLAVYFIYSFVRGLQERDFRDWNRAVLDGDRVTGFDLFGNPLATVDLSPGKTVYWAKVWIPKERGMAEPILVVSNHMFSLPGNAEQLFRTVFDKSRQLLIVGAPEHPSEWFPAAELIPVVQPDGANIML